MKIDISKLRNPVAGLLQELRSELVILQNNNISDYDEDEGTTYYSDDLNDSLSGWLSGDSDEDGESISGTSYIDIWLSHTNDLSGESIPDRWPNNSKGFRADFSLFSIISLLAASDSLGVNGDDVINSISGSIVEGTDTNNLLRSVLREIKSINGVFSSGGFVNTDSIVSSLNFLSKIPEDEEEGFESLNSYLLILGVQELLKNISDPNPLGEPAILPDWAVRVNRFVSTLTGEEFRATSVSSSVDSTTEPVEDPLTAPEFSSSMGDDLSLTVGDSIDFIVPEATGNPIPTYSASGLPAGITFAPDTREFEGDTTTAGSGTIIITATNSEGTDEYTRDWEIVDAFITQSFSLGAPSSSISDTYFFVNGISGVKEVQTDFTEGNDPGMNLLLVAIGLDGRIQMTFSLGPDELNDVAEEADGFVTFSAEGLDDLVVDGPNHSESTSGDATEPYIWTPSNSDEVTAFYNELTETTEVTMVFSIPE